MRSEQLLSNLQHVEWYVKSPGRVNLLGEHVDYNQGIVLPAAIDRFVEVAAAVRDERLVTLKALDMGAEVSFSLDGLSSRVDENGQPLPDWALYPAGVAWVLQNAGYALQGLEAVYTSEIPIGAGLSSSAAVEVAFAVLWQAVCGWDITRMRMAQLCQQAENQYVGVNCGLMDQFACAHGVARHALYFDVRSLEWQPLPLPPDTAIVIADSGVRRQLVGSEYNQRRAACDQAVRLLKPYLPHIQSLRDLSPAQFEEFAQHLPADIQMRARHVVEEIERVRQACLCLVRDDAAAFGALMYEGHASLRDLFEVSTPELDALVEIAVSLDGCFGARLSGAGFGGCTVNLVKREQADDFSCQLLDTYRQRFDHPARVYVCNPARGAYAELL